jgi:hypothetical protein
MESTGVSGKIHISNKTLELLHGEYAVEDGPELAKCEPILVKHDIKTYLISPKYDSIVENEAINQVLISSLPCPQVNLILITNII